MAILKMKKLSLIAPQENAQKLIEDLMWLSCVEIIPQEEKETTQDVHKVRLRMEKLTSALGEIAKYRTKKGLFGAHEEVSRQSFDAMAEDADRIYGLCDKVLELKEEYARLQNRVNSLDSQILQLMPWRDYGFSLANTTTEQCDITLGTLPTSCDIDALAESEEEKSFYILPISADREQKYVCVYSLKKQSDSIIKMLSSQGFTKVSFPEKDGTPLEITSRLEAEKKLTSKKLTENRELLRDYAKYADDFERLYDYENSRLGILGTSDGAFRTETTCMIRGWVPENKLKKLEKTLESYTCFYELCDPEKDDKPPVELKNNRFASAFEGLIELYSYPDYYGYDPLKYMSVFYCIIFGMMLADFVYGLLLTVGCFAAIKLMKPKKGMKAFLSMFALSGISTAFFGLLFGSIMGDLPSAFNTNMLGGEAFGTALWFDPTKEPMLLLYISFAMGAVHLLWGMGLKAYILFKRGQWVDAVCDIFTWYLVFLGIGVLAAGALTGISVLFEAGKWLSIAGVASLILTQGRAEKNIIMKLMKGIMSLYDIVNYVADLLSYSRILALGLATAVVSSVINIMATLAGPSVIGFIMFVLILALGHSLNIALNVLGSFVHASRLQYIEFFGKFYEDGGRHFSPLSVGAKYTNINTEEN